MLAAPARPKGYGARPYARALCPFLFSWKRCSASAHSLSASSFREITSSQKKVTASYFPCRRAWPKLCSPGTAFPHPFANLRHLSGPDGHPPRPDTPRGCVPPSLSKRHSDDTVVGSLPIRCRYSPKHLCRSPVSTSLNVRRPNCRLSVLVRSGHRRSGILATGNPLFMAYACAYMPAA